MAKRKLAPLLVAMSVYETLDERDRATFTEWIKSKQPKKSRKPAQPAGKKSLAKGGEKSSTASTVTMLEGTWTPSN